MAAMALVFSLAYDKVPVMGSRRWKMATVYGGWVSTLGNRAVDAGSDYSYFLLTVVASVCGGGGCSS
ncbi:hypothetical protein M8C21_026659 [Ambrosia artemisiifolia]|uniref:Uncharacterized protein n=1 Tax=Ambrosia artemisiifolia TaxID=4212 RepID=A0AAD5GV13_AMBAR|nr:hypothetical protein M8C21_026659 [Ambrosia artemisiifolia]